MISTKDHGQCLYALEMPEPPEKSDDGETVSIVFVNVLTIPNASCDNSKASSGVVSEVKSDCGASLPPESEKEICENEPVDDKDSENKVQVLRARFGAPYVMQMRRETGFHDFQKLLLKEMQQMVLPSILFAEQKVRLHFYPALDCTSNDFCLYFARSVVLFRN